MKSLECIAQKSHKGTLLCSQDGFLKTRGEKSETSDGRFVNSVFQSFTSETEADLRLAEGPTSGSGFCKQRIQEKCHQPHHI